VSRRYRPSSAYLKTDLGPFSYSWEIAGFVFIALTMFWIAIWFLDFGYYNKLLVGAVAALLELEARSKTSNDALEITLSTRVEESVSGTLQFPRHLTRRAKAHILFSRWAFYVIVLAVLIAGAGLSFYIDKHPRAVPAEIMSPAAG
jgi:hypothetical protein